MMAVSASDSLTFKDSGARPGLIYEANTGINIFCRSSTNEDTSLCSFKILAENINSRRQMG